jgi:cytochrome c553
MRIFLLLLLFTPFIVNAEDFDIENAEEINEVCASCHGEFGQGGKQGEYPRIAGQPSEFIIDQLKLFRTRTRANMPMLPHTEKRDLPDEDVRDISIYLSLMELPMKLPPLNENDENFDALERLMLTKKTLNIPQAIGNIKLGQKSYNKECKICHGKLGFGKNETPMIAGQYTNYLWRQVNKYIAGKRIHDKEEPDDELLKDFTKTELEDIFAYLSIVDDY